MLGIEVLENKAVEAALYFRWQEAIHINELIIKNDKSNICAYLRLGFAYMQTNEWPKAKKCYLKALKIQPGHNLAKENLEKIKVLENRSQKKQPDKPLKLDPNLFLEIPGKTKAVVLVTIGQKNVLAHLSIGQPVNLKTKRRKIEIRTNANEYVGCLPDDLSKRLTFFIKANSRFAAFIKEANLNQVVIFIKEENKGRKVKTFLSFPKNIQSNLNHMNSDEENSCEETNEHEWIDEPLLSDGREDEESEIFNLRQEEDEEEEE